MRRRHILPFARPEEPFTVERSFTVDRAEIESIFRAGCGMEIQQGTYASGRRCVRAVVWDPASAPGEPVAPTPGPADVLPLRRFAVAGR